MTTKALALVSELDRYVAQIKKYPILTQEEETALSRRWIDHKDVQAAHQLVTSNLRFVVKIANEYKGYQARVLDLIQEGSIGLMHAVKRFDPDRGYRLITYSVYWIRSYIHSYLMRTTRMFKVGTSRAGRKLFFKLRSLKGKLASEGITDHDEVMDTVAQQTGVSRADVDEMNTQFTSRDDSLDAPVTDSGLVLADTMSDAGPSQEEQLAELEFQADRSARLEMAMQQLDDREREIITRRHLSESPLQLKELGEQWGVSKQRVAQLERRAMKKLRGVLDPAA